MKKTVILNFNRAAIAALLAVIFVSAGLAQGPQPPRPSIKGAELKGKAPVNKEILKATLPKPYETKLSNGLQVLILEDHHLPTFNMQMVIMSGGMSDPADRIGTAQYTATMLREGTRSRDTKKIAEDLDSLGASLFASSGLTSTTSNVSASGLIENFDRIMGIFSDVVLNPSFPAEEFNKIKQRGLAQLRLQRSQPSFLSGEMFSKVIYGSHPAARFSLKAEQIQGFTPEMLQKFHETYYRPNNAVFAIVGDVKPAEVVAKLEKAFASWKPADVPKTEIPKVQDAGATKIYLIDRPGSVQTNLVLGTLGITRTDPDYFALEMMNQVLGAGASARLFLNLREDKGYTYGAYSDVSSFKYRGTFRASSEVRTDVTKGAMDEFMNEFRRIRNEITTADEFDRARRSIIGGWALQLESSATLLQNAITLKIYGLPADYWDTYPQKIAAVTPDDVKRVAIKYLDLGKLQVVAVGDAKKIADGLRQFGPLEIYDSEGKPVKSAASPATPAAPDNGSAAAAGKAEIAGAWALLADTPDGQLSFKLNVKQDGKDIVGNIETPFGSFPVNGFMVNPEQVSMKASMEIEGRPLALVITGKLSGANMSGQMSAEGLPSVNFTGKKEK